MSSFDNRNRRRDAIERANANRASAPQGGRAYPAGAAGTQLVSGLVLSGDDAPAFERAGYSVLRCNVQCSAEVAAGRQTVDPDAEYIIAIERHGLALHAIERLTRAADVVPATGIYAGATNRAAVGFLRGADIRAAHDTLKREHGLFKCFAILTPLDAA